MAVKDPGDAAAGDLTMRPSGRFGSFFWTQFLGALNDNVFKNALVILVAYRSMTIAGLSAPQVVALCGGLLILPFVLFSALAGQLADRYSKSSLIRWIKAAEVPIMMLGAVGFAMGSLPLLLTVLFLMGTQSSFFGPVKYSILPQLLEREDLLAGNARVETGTFLAILLGTIIGGVLVAQGVNGAHLVSVVVVIGAAAGFAVSLRIPPLIGQSPGLRISINPLPPLRETFGVTVANRTVLHSILGVSWFWFLGSAILSLLPAYVKSVRGADESVVTLFLALFCIGIAVGSQLCERLSGHTVELGIVPIGSLGMSLAAFDLWWVGAPSVPSADAALLGTRAFLATAGSWRVVFDLTALAAFSGLFVVPLYALIQQRSDAAHRSRVIAGSNIMGAVFMVASSVMLIGLLGAGMSIPRIFGILALLNTAVAVYIYQIIPEFLFRFAAWVAANIMYRLRSVGTANIPSEGAAVLVANHVSFVDWLLVASVCERPPRFVMYHGYEKLPFVGWLFRDAKVIPIAPAHESERTMWEAFDRIAAELEAGELVCVFPEGKLTADGGLVAFRPGIEKIVRRTPVPVVPMAIVGMWGSFFSRKDGAPLRRPFRRVWSRVTLIAGPAVAPEQVTAHGLEVAVADLGGFALPTGTEQELRRGDLSPDQPS